MRKTILYINATPDNSHPLKIIRCVADAYGYDIDEHRYFNLDNFKKALSNASRPIDILYVAAHGNAKGISLEDEVRSQKSFVYWPELAAAVCEADGLSDDSIVYLACCDGGFKRAALVLMALCGKINFVGGMPCKLDLSREALAFHTFLDHLTRYSDAGRIMKAVEAATDHQFNLHIRNEMDAEIASFIRYCPQLCFTEEEYAKLQAESRQANDATSESEAA